MGLFDALETPIEDIPTGFGLPNGTHEVVVTDIKNYNHNGTDYVITEYTAQEGKLNGKKHSVWTTVPQPGSQYLDIQASVMKSTLANLGVPESEMANFDPDDADCKDGVIGIEGTLNIKPQKKDPQYSNAYFKMSKDNEESGASDTQLEPTEGESTFDPNSFA